MQLSNRLKLAATLTVVSAVAFGIASYIAVRSFEDNQLSQFRTVLETSLEARIEELNNYAQSVENDLKIVGSISLVQTAADRFSEAFKDLGPNPESALQRIYIKENPHGASSRHNLLMARDGSDYSRLHGEYHAWFSTLAQARDYYDLFLADIEGNIVYTVFKEEDLGTNLLTGALKNTSIADVYRRAIKGPPGGVLGSSFSRYTPSKNIPAAFQGTPLYSRGRVVGVLIVQLRIDPFNQILLSAHQLGDSFESYAVNADRLMVSQSRFIKESILTQKVDNHSVKSALAGATGFGIVKDYRGTLVLSAYRPFNKLGFNWAVLAELDEDELKRNSVSLRFKILIAGICVAIAAALIGWFMAARD